MQTTKTERVTLLTSRDFKAFLSAEARREGISVAELVRTRCERRPTEQEALLATLTAELNHAVGEARKALQAGLDEARGVLVDLRAGRTRSGRRAANVAPARRVRRTRA